VDAVHKATGSLRFLCFLRDVLVLVAAGEVLDVVHGESVCVCVCVYVCVCSVMVVPTPKMLVFMRMDEHPVMSLSLLFLG
jgi:hypothetical protein